MFRVTSAISLLSVCVWAASAALADDVRTVARVSPDGTMVVHERMPSATDTGLAEPGEGGAGGTLRDGILWHKFESQPVYTTAGISTPDGSVSAGTWLNPPKEFEYFELEGDEIPEWVYPGTEFHVAVSRNADVLAALDYDFASQTATVYKWHPESSTPDWSYTINPCGLAHRGILVSPDGSTIAVLVTMYTDPSTARLFYFDPDSSVPLGTYDPPGGSFARNFGITEHGEFIAVYAAASIYVFDVDADTERWSASAGASSDVIAISGDGQYLAYGWPGLTFRQWDGASYTLLWTRSVSNFRTQRCAFSTDGSTFIIGWNRNDYLQNRIELFDVPADAPTWTYLYAAGTGAYQDIPDDIALTADGSYIAVASWGDSGNTNPEVHIFRHADSTPVFTVDTPGSMFDVDIAAACNGDVYVSACGKHVNANEQGRGADLYAIRIDSPYPPGDLDFDGDVDLTDLAQLLAHYGMTSGATYEDGDLDCDGDVDLGDLAALLANYGTGG
jgi:WD40 repeat protein